MDQVNNIEVRLATLKDVELLVKFNYEMAKETEDKELSIETLTSGVSNCIKSPKYG